MAKQLSFSNDADYEVFRVEPDKNGRGWKRFNMSSDMKDKAKANGVTGFITNGSIYVSEDDDSIVGEEELFVIVSTQAPKGWNDPTVKAKKQK